MNSSSRVQPHMVDSYETEEPKRTTNKQSNREIPLITINDSGHNSVIREECSDTETEMSSSHHSHHSHHAGSSSKGKHASSSSSSSKSKSSKTDDWSDITDPEERRRAQNRIAQRKFRDKAKDNKERQERDAENRTRAGYSYHTPDPNEMIPDDDLSGLPWGSLSMKHVVSKGMAKESGSGRGSSKGKSAYGSQEPVYDDRDVYHEGEPSYYEDQDRAYYDYGSGSGH